MKSFCIASNGVDIIFFQQGVVYERLSFINNNIDQRLSEIKDKFILKASLSQLIRSHNLVHAMHETLVSIFITEFLTEGYAMEKS